jgi:predicted component of type VI protein secretion system
LKARQNPLTKLEALIQRWVEGPFARLFPSRLEPVEIERKLERAMEDNTRLQSEGRRLAPNVYDIYLSIKDHQQISPSQNMLVRDWQNQLVDFARHRHFTLRTTPVIRLHSDTSLHTGTVRIEAELADRQSGSSEGEHMATQALSVEQMAQLRAQIATAGQPMPPGLGGSSPNQPSLVPIQPPGNSGASSQPGTANNYGQAPIIPPTIQAQVNMPQAWLTIRLPQAGQQTYRIEKPIINIGRQLSNDIIVEDKRVSRNHAQIKFQQDGQFAIFDLGSTNGITINNVPHLRHHILHNGDRFTIGNYDFYFERR